jgi:hypothetical protein
MSMIFNHPHPELLGYETIFVSAADMIAPEGGDTPPVAYTQVEISDNITKGFVFHAWEFDSSSYGHVQWNVKFPANYDPDKAFALGAYYLAKGSEGVGTGNIRGRIRHKGFADGASLANADGWRNTTLLAPGPAVANAIPAPVFAGSDTSQTNPSGYTQFQYLRHGGHADDTYLGNIYLIGATVAYQTLDFTDGEHT